MGDALSAVPSISTVFTVQPNIAVICVNLASTLMGGCVRCVESNTLTVSSVLSKNASPARNSTICRIRGHVWPATS